MQEKHINNFHPLCICRRLFDFIVNRLIARGVFTKGVTSLDHPLPSQSSINVPYSLMNEVASTEKEQLMVPAKSDQAHGMAHQDGSDFTILVHHKETDDLEYWTPVDNLGSPLYLSDYEDGTLDPSPERAQLQHEQIQESSAVHEVSSANTVSGTSASHVKGEHPQEVEAIFTAVTRTKSSGSKKMVGLIKDLVKEEKNGGKNKQSKSMSRDKLTLALEADDHQDQMETKPPVRQVRPLFNVAMSINEKSDAFIRSRKAAMRNSYSFGTPNI